jgi:SAM-dependent methyltransferase
MLPSRLQSLHDFWVRTGLRQLVTRDLRTHIASLRGTALDVGGGRSAPHDDAWPERLRRIRIDLSTTHDPDVVGDATALPVRPESVDSVVMAQLLEHVPDPGRALSEAYRVLRPGGSVHGTVPFVFPIHGDPHDYFRFSEAALHHLLREFTEVRIRPLGNPLGSAWYLVSFRSRVLRVLNPAMRLLGRRPDAACPQGYAFTAVK